MNQEFCLRILRTIFLYIFRCDGIMDMAAAVSQDKILLRDLFSDPAAQIVVGNKIDVFIWKPANDLQCI